MSVCALSGGVMEDQYLNVVKKHAAGDKGKRGCDSLAQLFGQLIETMEQARKDILGDLFQGGITYGEAGQFYTPESITQLLAAITIPQDGSEPVGRRTVCDPCCGSGRMLLAVAERQPHWEFIGQDIDLRCVRMTAINLALWNRYGYVLWGDSLKQEQKLVYRTGFTGRGFLRQIQIEECPAPVIEATAATPGDDPIVKTQGPTEAVETPMRTGPAKQLKFF